MDTQYTAERIEGTDNGWLVTSTENGAKKKVFCNSSANTAEDAITLVTAPPLQEDPQ